MKKAAVIITTALAALSFSVGTAAYAEETSSYPDLASELGFTSLSAYAVNEDENRFAFAEGNYIYLFDGEEVSGNKYSGTLENNGAYLYYFEYTDEIYDLAFDGDTLVFTADGQNTYTISDGQAVSYDYEMPSFGSFVTFNSIIYTVTESYYLSAWDGNNQNKLSDGTYSSLKICGNNLYVIFNNTLCKVSGNVVADLQVNTLSFEYIDLTQGGTIEIGNTEDVLSSLQTDVNYVTLPAGTYVTNADLTDLSGQYFKVGSYGTYALTSQTTMFYLGTTSDGIDILSYGGDIYLAASGNTKTTLKAESYSSASAYLNTDAKVYSMPYISDLTQIGSVEFEDIVTVNGIYTSDILQCSFASISYTDGSGSLITGYVAANFITEYYFAAEEGSYGEAEFTDGYADDNVILTVCIIIVIVVLAIAGVAYIGYSSSANRRNIKKHEDDDDL